MKHKATLILAAALVLILGLYMTSFQVRFNEVAVVTTFGKATEASVLNAEGHAAGLHWKLPWPIQEVRLYDSRVQLLEDRLEEQQTLDKQDVILNAFVAWRISEPLAFFRSLRNIPEAEKQLRARLRDARGEIGRFAFEELTHPDPAKLRLAQAETAIAERLRASLRQQGYGLEIQGVGIKQILLPESVTQKVFERMRATRLRLAQQARSEGEAAASGIRASANSDRERILAFAQRRAEDIRSEGLAESANQYRRFKANEELAIFLRKLETLREILKSNTTIILDNRIDPFDEFQKQDRLGPSSSSPAPRTPPAVAPPAPPASPASPAAQAAPAATNREATP